MKEKEVKNVEGEETKKEMSRCEGTEIRNLL